MKTNRMLNEILRGTWLLNISALDALAPVLHNIFSGQIAYPEAREIPLLEYYDFEGALVSDQNEKPEGQVAVVSMVGPVIKYGDMCTYGADEIVTALDRANNDSRVSAIVLYIDGPGGATSAISPFVSFAARKKKPVIALVDSAYSLHYWAAVAVADHIMADNAINSGVGSVGVYLSFMDAKGYYEEKGFKLHEIYAEQSTHKNEAFRLALENKYDQIRTEMLNPIAIKFQQAVKSGRPNLKEAPGVLTGKTFYAEEALQLGMIDSIGSLERAIHLANALAEIKNY